MSIVKNIRFQFILLLFCGFASAKAQEFIAGEEITLKVNDYSLIETNHAPVSLNMGTGTLPGQPIVEAANSDMFVKISSIVPGGTHRKMTVRMSSGTVPAGTKLTCISAACTTTNSGGDLGIPVATPITLNTLDQDVVIQIGTCYTGTGYTDGYQITYTWSPDATVDYSQITATSTNVTVVFTLTAHDGNN